MDIQTEYHRSVILHTVCVDIQEIISGQGTNDFIITFLVVSTLLTYLKLDATKQRVVDTWRSLLPLEIPGWMNLTFQRD